MILATRNKVSRLCAMCGGSFSVTACGSTVSDPHIEAFQKFHGASSEAVTLRRKKKKKGEK